MNSAILIWENKQVTGFMFCNWFSGWLFWSGSSEWRVVEAQWQRGNSRLLHDSSDVDTDLWSDRQMDRHVRQLHSTYDYVVEFVLDLDRDVFEDSTVEAKAKAKAKARSFRIKVTYAYEIII